VTTWHRAVPTFVPPRRRRPTSRRSILQSASCWSCRQTLGKIEKNAGTDYRYRAKAKRSEVAEALAKLVQDLDYENFKSEVAKKQGKHRAAAYEKVWGVPCKLQTGSEQYPSGKSKSDDVDPREKPRAYGGVVIDADKRILLRRPKGDFDGYVWTFPKGRPDAGETAEEAALRELKEETGYSAKVVGKVPGSFRGGTSVTEYFLMSPVGSPSPFSSETSAIQWVTFDKAAELIGMTTNEIGRARDLSVLGAARLTLKSSIQNER
jgi:8-oxo-dGTP pyrophosphatase MutT (NUDIX family)